MFKLILTRKCKMTPARGCKLKNETYILLFIVLYMYVLRDFI